MATGWSIAEGTLPSNPTTTSDSAVSFSPAKGMRRTLRAACPAELAGDGDGVQANMVEDSPLSADGSDSPRPSGEESADMEDLELQLQVQELAALAAERGAQAAQTRLLLSRAKKQSDSGSNRSRTSRRDARSPRGDPRLRQVSQPSGAAAVGPVTAPPADSAAPMQMPRLALTAVAEGQVEDLLELFETEGSATPSVAPTEVMRAPRLDRSVLQSLGAETALARYRRSRRPGHEGTPPDLEAGGEFVEPHSPGARWDEVRGRWVRTAPPAAHLAAPQQGPSLVHQVFAYGITQAEEAAQAVITVAERRHTETMEHFSAAAQHELASVERNAESIHLSRMNELAEAADAALAGQALGTAQGLRHLRTANEHREAEFLQQANTEFVAHLQAVTLRAEAAVATARAQTQTEEAASAEQSRRAQAREEEAQHVRALLEQAVLRERALFARFTEQERLLVEAQRAPPQPPSAPVSPQRATPPVLPFQFVIATPPASEAGAVTPRPQFFTVAPTATMTAPAVTSLFAFGSGGNDPPQGSNGAGHGSSGDWSAPNGRGPPQPPDPGAGRPGGNGGDGDPPGGDPNPGGGPNQPPEEPFLRHARMAAQAVREESKKKGGKEADTRLSATTRGSRRHGVKCALRLAGRTKRSPGFSPQRNRG